MKQSRKDNLGVYQTRGAISWWQYSLTLFIVFLMFAFVGKAKAQQKPFVNHIISAQASLSMEETSEYSFGYHYLFCKYVGIGANIGAWSIDPDGGILGENKDDFFERQNPYVQPSLVLKTPSLFFIKHCEFHVECEPGVMFSTRRKVLKLQGDMETYKEWKTDYISYNCNFGLVVGYKNVNLVAFYSLSNLDVNRQYKSKDQNSYKKKLVESLGLKIAFPF